MSERDVVAVSQAAVLYSQIMVEMARDMTRWMASGQTMVETPRIVVRGENGVTAVFTIDREETA